MKKNKEENLSEKELNKEKLNEGKSTNEQEKENQTFKEKYKNDPKYKAKVQLIGYGVFILFLIVYLNIASIGAKNTKLSNTTTKNNDNIPTKENNNIETKTDKELGQWLKDIGTNYEYDVVVSSKSKNDNGEEANTQTHYWGKTYQNKMIINKEANGSTTYFLKEDNNYYLNELDNYTLSKKEAVYSEIDEDIIEFDMLNLLLKNASLDHVTNYSSGKKEYEYHLKIRDIIKTYQEDTELSFEIVIEDNVVTVEVDYAPMINIVEQVKKQEEYKVTYLYKNIGKIEEFPGIEKDTKTGEITNG